MKLVEIHIEVENLEKSAEFYQTLFPDCKRVEWKDNSATALVLSDGSAIGIWKKGKTGMFDGRGASHAHFAVQIDPDEYDIFLNRLKKLKVEYQEHVWKNNHRSIYFNDPDKHQGEFITCDWLELFDL